MWRSLLLSAWLAASFTAAPAFQTRRFSSVVVGLKTILPDPATRLHAAGQGFGGGRRESNGDSSSSSSESQPKSNGPPAKTYGDSSNSRPIRDLIDADAAMREFFETREDWIPVFRHISLDSCPATEILGSRRVVGDSTREGSSLPLLSLELRETVKLFPATPSSEEDRMVVAGFLDSMQQNLLDIPVTDSAEDDENDVQFVEEGRRLLALSRFHVLRRASTAPIGDEPGELTHFTSSPPSWLESYDALFEIAWSELTYLIQQAEEHTGSLILLPDHNLSEARRFADMNLQRPLEWMGLQDQFEVTSLQRHAPAIRLLYRLRDAPKQAPPTTPVGDMPRQVS